MHFVEDKWTKQKRKWKIPYIVSERRTLCLSSYKNHKLKVKLWWARERKKRLFFVPFILCDETFFIWKKNEIKHLRFISMYSELNTLSEYTYFLISKTISPCTILLAFKMVEIIQRILKACVRYFLKMHYKSDLIT